MKKVLALALLLAPATARSEVGLRVGGALDLYFQDFDGFFTRIHGFTDLAPVEGQLMISWWLPRSFLSLDLELAEGLYLNTPSDSPVRNGTALRPGIRVVPFAIPFYARVAASIYVERPAQYDRVPAYNVRFGLGTSVPFAGKTAAYLEADLDGSVGIGKGSRDAFTFWHFWLNVGVDFRL